MAKSRWSAPGTRSSNLAGLTLNGLANGTESTVVTYNNGSDREYYGLLTIKLGTTASPGVSTGGSITVRITLNDGTDSSDQIGGDLYVIPLTTGTSSKIVMQKIQLYPFQNRISIINNSGITFAASNNQMFITPWGEEVI